MFNRKKLSALFLTAALPICSMLHAEAAKTRVIIMADMDNEPDEEQQMIHMFMYSNMFDLEGLLAVSGKYMHTGMGGSKGIMHPELWIKLIDGYGSVLPNLKLHAKGWPEVAYLKRIVRAGTADYGMAAVKHGNSSDASRFLEAAILKNDPRKLYIIGNAGTNTLAQALLDLDRTRTNQEMEVLCQKIIVFENGTQDDAGAWIAGKYPAIVWYRSDRQTYSYGGPAPKGITDGPYTWEPYPETVQGQRDWTHEHIVNNHGALGALYPDRVLRGVLLYLEGGGTIPFMGLAVPGLSHIEHLYWGGWSGRLSRTKHTNIYSQYSDVAAQEKLLPEFQMYEADSEIESWTDPVSKKTFTSFRVPVWRFRRAMFNDFRARMDWCVQPFNRANHNPIAVFGKDSGDTIVHLSAAPGESIPLDASLSSDPDNDSISVKWWIYREAGTYTEDIALNDSTSPTTALTVPDNAQGKEIHVILEVEDKNSIIPMFDYRRIVIKVTGNI